MVFSATKVNTFMILFGAFLAYAFYSINENNNLINNGDYFYWEYSNYKIEHFIKDRCGKMEGIFVEFFNT